MSKTYTVYIENASQSSKRELSLTGTNPMDVHKAAYLKATKYEEIRDIRDCSGNIVFNVKTGFCGRY